MNGQKFNQLNNLARSGQKGKVECCNTLILEAICYGAKENDVPYRVITDYTKISIKQSSTERYCKSCENWYVHVWAEPCRYVELNNGYNDVNIGTIEMLPNKNYCEIDVDCKGYMRGVRVVKRLMKNQHSQRVNDPKFRVKQKVTNIFCGSFDSMDAYYNPERYIPFVLEAMKTVIPEIVVEQYKMNNCEIVDMYKKKEMRNECKCKKF